MGHPNSLISRFGFVTKPTNNSFKTSNHWDKISLYYIYEAVTIYWNLQCMVLFCKSRLQIYEESINAPKPSGGAEESSAAGAEGCTPLCQRRQIASTSWTYELALHHGAETNHQLWSRAR